MNRNEQLVKWIKDKAIKTYQDKSTLIQLLPIFLIFSFLCFVLPILSGVTEFTELYHELNANNSIIGLIMAILTLIAIEGIKVVSVSICLIKWFSGKLTGIGLFIILGLAAQSASVYFSIQGSKRVPKILHEAPEHQPPVLVNIDSLSTLHDSIIAAKEAIRDDFFKQYHKTDAKTGEERLSSAYAEDKRAQDMDIRTAEQEKKIQVNNAIEENKRTLKDSKAEHLITLKRFNNKINVSSSKMWYWSIIIETLFIISSLFVFWYLSESLGTDKTDNETDNIPTNKGLERISATDNGTNKTAIAHLGTNKKKRITDNCLNCNKCIKHKRIDAKYCDSNCRGDHFKMKNK